METLSFMAGMLSSFIFAGSNIPMLWKAYRTKDLHSYSLFNLVLINVGNLIYWLYVANLPLGPIWILHSFYTISAGVLLIMYWQQPTRGGNQTLVEIRQKIDRLRFSTLRYLVWGANFVRPDRPLKAGAKPIRLARLTQVCCGQ